MPQTNVDVPARAEVYALYHIHYRTLFATGLRNQVFGRRMWLFRTAGSLKSSELSIQAGKKPGFLKSVR